MRVTYATGQCRTATDRQGPRYHAVPGVVTWGGGDWTAALCGYVPGRRSNGWSDYQGQEVTCPKCLAKLAKLEAQL